MINHSYKGYTADKLLTDDYFIQSELHPTEESKRFWSELEKDDFLLSEQIRLARLVLQTIRYNAYVPTLSDVEEQKLWKKIESINKKRSRKKMLFLSAISTAAAALFALLIMLNKTAETESLQNSDYHLLIEAAKKEQDNSGKIQLVLSDKKKLNLEGKESEIEYEEGDIKVNSERIEISEEEKAQQIHNTLIVPVGKRSSLVLADGTKLWVNSDSKVVYPVRFKSDKREIYIEGEVYLDVNENKDVPFVLKTKDAEITVLGTEFNVTAYENETYTDIVLVEGKVEVLFAEKEKSILSPNQLIRYNLDTKQTVLREVENMADFTAWKDGYYQFRKQTMDLVLRKVAKYYGLQLEWEQQVDGLICSGKLDLKDNPSDVLKTLMKAAPIEVEQVGEKYMIKVKP